PRIPDLPRARNREPQRDHFGPGKRHDGAAGLRTSRSRGSTWRLPLGHAHPSVASAAKKYTFLTTTPQKRILFCGPYDEKVYFFEAQAREARRDRTTTHGNEPLVARHELDKPRPRPRTRRHGAVRLSTR